MKLITAIVKPFTLEDIKAGRLPKNFLDPDYDHGI